MKLKLIVNGIEDEVIKTEYEKMRNSNDKKGGKLDCLITLIFCCVLIACFAFSIYANVSTKVQFENVPSFFVVKSASMAKKHENNKYLVENDLNNQFQTHDLILVYKAPDQFDLKLYDIVVYEVDDVLVIHRIVNIEEPNVNHPNERYFLCQGDAVHNPDRFPVKYEQIRGIYRDEKVPFIGSFVGFFQSPAGWLCILLLVASTIFTPLIEKIIKKASDARLAIILQKAETSSAVEGSLAISSARTSARTRNVVPFSVRFTKLSKRDKDYYYKMVGKLSKIRAIKAIDWLGTETYKAGGVPIAKFAIKRRKLEVYFAIKNNLSSTNYIVSDTEKYKIYPKCVKVSSDRALEKALTYIDVVCDNNCLAVLEGKK